MLMGFRPDEVFDEEQLVSQNLDQKEGAQLKWPFPPVLLLEAERDNSYYKDRMHRTFNFLKQQVGSLLLFTCLCWMVVMPLMMRVYGKLCTQSIPFHSLPHWPWMLPNRFMPAVP